MAYRKQWYTWGIRSNSEMTDFPDSRLNNGDTYFSIEYEKPMYLNDTNLITNQIGCGKIWLNEDMIFGYSPNNTDELGTPVSIMINAAFSPDAISLPLTPAVDYTYTDFVGVVAMVPNSEISSDPQGRGIAIQGMYDVRFTEATTYVQQGNLAILSSTPGRAVQTGATAELGVIGVIMESKTLGIDKLAKVMIQAFSSK